VAFFTALAIASLVAGTTMKVAGDIKAGNAAKRAGEAQRDAAESAAQLDDYNAQVADLQAKDATERGVEEESKFRMGVRGMIGTQRAGIAASNIDVGFGSAADVQADAAFLGELDSLAIRTNAAREAWGFQVQGEDLRRHAQITRKEGAMALEAGKAAQSASRWGAASTILGTTSLLADKYGHGRGGSSGGD